MNGQSLLGVTHQEAVRALRGVGEKLNIMVCEGFDASEVELLAPTSGTLTGTRQDSVSSIDREDEDTLLIQKVCLSMFLSS